VTQEVHAPPPQGEKVSGSVTNVLALSVPDALAALSTSSDGLDADESARRLLTNGPNAFPSPKQNSLVLEFLAQFANMFAVLLVVASGLTFATYLLTAPRNTANLDLAFGILGVVFLNSFIGFFQEHAAERTAQALQAMVPHSARVLRLGELVEIPAEQLVVGDVVVLEAGDTISADCRLIEAFGLSVEMAALTGESQPLSRRPEPVSQDGPPLEASNCLFTGTSVSSGTGKAVVFATGLRTEFGRIYRLTAELPRETSPLQRQVSHMARRVAIVAIIAGVLLFAIRVMTGNPASLSFVFALGVMVALVPEGLPATLSVSLAIGVRRMASRHALIKRLVVVETLGSTTVICTDKTGTITNGEMTLLEIFESGHNHSVTGLGYAPEGEVEDSDKVVNVLRIGALCSDARLLAPTEGRGWRILGDSTEGAILVAATKAGVDIAGELLRTPRVGDFPFDADRKIMTTLHQVGDGVEAFVKGSPQALIERCSAVQWDGRVVPLSPELRQQIERANDAMANSALRVLAIATRKVDSSHVDQEVAEHGLTLLGLVGMVDPPRAEVAQAVTDCHRAGIAIFMVTGDYGLTAEAIARRVGIVQSSTVRVVTGSDLDAMSEDELVATLRAKDEVIFARVRPEHKLRIVLALKNLGEIVVVTGDGANDAPALKSASVGVAMNVGGTDVARAAAEMLLLDDSFASIVSSIELGRAVYQNIRRFLVYLFSHNLAELAPILVAAFVGFPLVPLSALQVLAIDLGSDVLPALALGAEAPERDTMNRPPRSSSEHLFSSEVVRRFMFLGAIESVGVVFAFFWRIHTAHLAFSGFTSSNPTYREALTMTQAGIVVSQFFNSFAVRTDRVSVFRIGVFSNPPLIAAGAFGLAFVSGVSYVPFLQRVFNTAALRVSDWLILIGFGAMLLVADEIRKAVHRHFKIAQGG
jgi:calcium-translocating P-type ATPase